MRITNRPWVVNKGKKWIENIDGFAVCDFKFRGVRWFDDARFIVRAVNSYEALLKSCKSLIEFLKLPMNARAEDELKAVILEINEAIKKAEGK